MKKFMAILLALLLLSAAALAEVDDGFGYVDLFTLEDGTELPVTVEHKTDWEYNSWNGTQVAEDVPMYTVTIPEGTENVHVYLTDFGRATFIWTNMLYSYAYIADSDTVDLDAMVEGFSDEGEYFLAPVRSDYSYAWEVSDTSVKAILVFEVGELPTPDQPAAGDVNGDKSVTVDDAILVLRHIANLETLSDSALTAVDMNGDGGVDVNDAIAILSKIASAN